MLEELGITLVRLNLPFRLNHVNCFMAEGEDGWTIIDAGLNNKETRECWQQYTDGKEISNLFVTHYHPDHFGYIGGLQKATGAHVSMSEIDYNAGLKAWSDDFFLLIEENYKKAGIPIEMAQEMVENTSEFKRVVNPLPEINHYFKQGEVVPFGRFDYEVLFAPGHSDGMVSFYNKEKSVLLAADHILPRITPNISYWFHGDENPLASYLSSLKQMKELDIDFVIPSHGKPFHGANKRIDELISHHEERLEETLAAIKEDTTVHEACERLFRRELTVHEIRFAIGETLAHLEYLRHTGQCSRELREGKWLYRRKG